MTDQPELLPCPFCKGKAQLSLDDDAYYCEDCGAMPYVEKGCDPVDVWNTRPRTIPAWLKEQIKNCIVDYNYYAENKNEDPIVINSIKSGGIEVSHLVSTADLEKLKDRLAYYYENELHKYYEDLASEISDGICAERAEIGGSMLINSMIKLK